MLLLLAACASLPGGEDTADCDTIEQFVDQDGDGFGDPERVEQGCPGQPHLAVQAGDCDDTDSEKNPDIAEKCNDVDDDCNGQVDDEAIDSFRYYTDADGDGYGDEATRRETCVEEAGVVDQGGDCDDVHPAVHPGATEMCNGTDDDCDGDTDEADAADATTWYADADADGHGDADLTVVQCALPPGYAAEGDDCDDDNGTIHPGAPEYCDGGDDDCDGDVDESEAVDAVRRWPDRDGDLYGDEGGGESFCDPPAGWVETAGDSDDDDAAVNAGATEWCDTVDNDCDGSTDEDDAADALTFHPDSDTDGYGDLYTDLFACAAPAGAVVDGTDCDDGAADVFPGADEYCNGSDDDCDGDTDETSALDALTWYQDNDSDGYGRAAVTASACSQPSGYVADDTDCDDTDLDTHPGADETCGGADENCDGTTDEDTAVDVVIWYLDADGDGYGKSSSRDADCDQPSGYVADATDCDDGTAAVNPAATEQCDRLDNNCDGDTDEDTAVDVATWYIDADGDGYGLSTTTDIDCWEPAGYGASAGDCDDADAAINPGEAEVCDAADTDEDCNGLADDDDPAVAGTASWYTDADGDGYGTGTATVTCEPDPAWVANDEDCDDTESAVSPGETEVCNDGLDNDCDGGSGSCEWSGTVAETDADLTYTGPATTAHMCFGLASDVDGDGDEEVLVYSGYDWTTSSAAYNWWQLPGGSTTSGTGALSKFSTLSSSSSVWWGSVAGDMDGDGDDDYTGSSSSFTGLGLYTGPITSTTAPSARYATLTKSASSYALTPQVLGADLDGDGTLEVILGDKSYGATYTGAVGVFEGPSGSVAFDSATWLLKGASASAYLGNSTAAVDLDADGRDDLVVAASEATSSYANEGLIYTFDSPTVGVVTTASATDLVYGGSASGRVATVLVDLGDHDDDGYEDVGVVSQRDNSVSGKRGSFTILAGSSGGVTSGKLSSVAAAAVRGPSSWWIDDAATGDFNGDGTSDIATMVDYYSYGGTGAVRVWYGPLSGAVDANSPDFMVSQSSAYRSIASDVQFADQDGDGLDDLLISSYYGTTGTSWSNSEGYGWIFWGGGL